MNVLRDLYNDIPDRSLTNQQRIAALLGLLLVVALLFFSTFCFLNGFVLVLDLFGWVYAAGYSVITTGFYFLVYMSAKMPDDH